MDKATIDRLRQLCEGPEAEEARERRKARKEGYNLAFFPATWYEQFFEEAAPALLGMLDEVERLRGLISEDHPGVGLKCIAEALSEPMECGHNVDCCDEDSGECLWCRDRCELERLRGGADRDG